MEWAPDMIGNTGDVFGMLIGPVSGHAADLGINMQLIDIVISFLWSSDTEVKVASDIETAG